MTNGISPPYHIIYADPPWPFSTWSSKAQRHVTDHYPTMTEQDLLSLPVSLLADRDCALLLWATCPHLPLALRTVEAWGFTYRSVAFVWVKTCADLDRLHLGCGYYTRSNAELCLLGARGSPKAVRHDVRQIIEAPVQEHSRKPHEARARIERLFGEVKRVELFATQMAAGWDATGLAVDGRRIEDVLSEVRGV